MYKPRCLPCRAMRRYRVSSYPEASEQTGCGLHRHGTAGPEGPKGAAKYNVRKDLCGGCSGFRYCNLHKETCPAVRTFHQIVPFTGLSTASFGRVRLSAEIASPHAADECRPHRKDRKRNGWMVQVPGIFRTPTLVASRRHHRLDGVDSLPHS